MRKKISCKVIRSVPLGTCHCGHRSAGKPDAGSTGVSNVAGFTRSGRPLRVTAWADDCMRSQILDLYA